MNILVINAGSSSLKYQFIKIEEEKVLAKGLCEKIGLKDSLLKLNVPGKDTYKIEKHMKDHSDAIKMVIDALTGEHGVISDMNEIDAVGHRVVHGGEAIKDSVLITDEVMKIVEDCVELAPLHNPANIIGIKACAEVMPNVPQVGVFDTAFHGHMPKEAFMYALPYKMYTDYKVRKYGFHGTSHKYVTQRAAKLLGKDVNDIKIITCHLGNGSSISAVKGGYSIDTTMGFTPLAGVPMGTRSGDIDPAIIMYLMDKLGTNADGINNILNKESGVYGISGVSPDFRDLSNAAADGNERAQLALNMFTYAVKKDIGAYAAALGGVDALVFTAGVGENDDYVREHVTDGLEFLGIKIDADKNKVRGEERDISADGATVKTFVIPTNEELMIAKDTARIVKGE